MRTRLAAAALAVSGLVFGLGASRTGSTADQWTSWRDSQIALMFQPGPDGLLSRERIIAVSSSAYRSLEPYLSDPSFLDDPLRGRPLRTFSQFIRTQAQNGKGQLLGMDVPDRDYWSFAAPNVKFPALLKSHEFLTAMSRPSGYADAVRMISRENAGLPEDRKWVVLAYRSGFIKSADQTTYGRLLVLVPNEPQPNGDLIDRWFQFAIAVPGEEPANRIRSVSEVAIRRDPLHPGSHWAYLCDFMRDPSSDGISLDPTALMDNSPSKTCYDCHKSTVVPIHPKVAFHFGPDGSLVADPSGGSEVTNALNARIEGYGLPDLGHLDTAADGPTLADSAEPVSDAFIASATHDAPLDTASYDKIRAAMVCASCHKRFAQVNYPQAVRTHGDTTAFESKTGIVQTYVERGWMPPGNTLSPAERHGLWQCVMKQYYNAGTGTGLLIDWLKDASPQP